MTLDEKISFISRDSLIILNWVTISLCILILIVDVYLISYHIMLIRKNMTTYKYIRAKMRKENVKSKVFVEIDRKNKPEQDENDASQNSENLSENANSVLES